MNVYAVFTLGSRCGVYRCSLIYSLHRIARLVINGSLASYTDIKRGLREMTKGIYVERNVNILIMTYIQRAFYYLSSYAEAEIESRVIQRSEKFQSYRDINIFFI